MRLIRITFGLMLILALSFFCTANAEENSIALLYSKYSETMTHSSPNWVINHLTAWELFLINNKIKYDVIQDGDLESGIEGDYQTLIVPAAKYLSDKEINSIKDFFNAGGSVLLTWQAGLYNEIGNYRGWGNLKSLLDINDISEMETDRALISCLIKAGNPLTTNTAAGSGIVFQTQNKPLQFTIDGHVKSPVIKNQLNSSSAVSEIAFGNSGKGKFVWFGFDILSVTGDKYQLQNFNEMVINSVNWLNNKPIIWINTWPENKSNAVVIGYDVDLYGNSLPDFIKILKDENARAQFFVPLNIANIDTITYLNKYGGISFFENNNYEWRNLSTKVENLQSLRSGVEEITGAGINSFRIPSSTFNETNLKALSNSGFTIVNCSLTNSNYLPWFDPKNKNLLIVPNTGSDDFYFSKNFKITKVEDLTDKYYEGYSKIAETGGLYVFNYHNVYKCMPGNLNAVGKFIQKLHQRAWITTFNELHYWWKLRSDLSVSIKKNESEDNSYNITLSNNSTLNGNKIELSLILGDLSATPIIKISEGTEKLNFVFNAKSNKVIIYINHISSGETKHLTLEIENS